ncbi:MAG: imidazole glycerol phosphate synthase subunit HisH, partial [Gemmiger sp.]
MKITVIDYGLSNLLSVQNAFRHFGAAVEVANTPDAVLAADALVLPGVGAFRDGMAGLERL